MYEQFYGLEKPAFNVTPDPEFLYQGPSHREALAAITYGVEQRKGFIALLGEVGLGKTTVLRSYIAGVDQARLSVAYVFNANVSFKELVHDICRDLNVTHPPQEELYWLVNRLHHFLLGEHRQGRNVLVVVDEAQNMPVETLENLRVLSNLESGQEKLLQMVLVGQTEFASTLEQHQVRQLRQRIAVRCTLDPLTPEQSREYIEFRLNRVGASTPNVFTRAAVDRIVGHAAGIPRVLNIVCDNALVTGLGYQTKPVTPAIVDEVIADLAGRRPPASEAVATVTPRPDSRRRWLWAAAAAVLVMAALPFAWPRLNVFVGNQQAARARGPVTAANTEAARGNVAGQAATPAPMQPPSAPPGQPAAALGVPSQSAAEAAARPSPTAPQPAAVKAAAPPDTAGFQLRGPEVARVVNAGDTLHSMALTVYGFVNDDVLRRVLQNNPDIADADTILVGSVIRFPDVSDLRALEAQRKR